MINLIFTNGLLEINGYKHLVENVEYFNDTQATVWMSNGFAVLLTANDTEINGIVQTSSQMIYDTLINGQS
jgi:hypothetical protein